MTSKIIIGSTALNHWFPDARKPKDIDVLCDVDIKSTDSEKLFIDTSWHAMAQELIDASTNKVFLDADLLYTLKVSHAQFDVFWGKTIADIMFMKKKGCKVNQEIHDKLIPVWSEMHGKKRINHNKPMAEFFNDYVNRLYPHEHLHELLALPNRPLHESIRPDLSNVMCSKEMFFDLCYAERISTCMEEAVVTAVERKKLDVNSTTMEKMDAYRYAYKRMCVSMCKGWFAQFLIENCEELLLRQKEHGINMISKLCVEIQNYYG